jgi:hypothetical protein
LSNGTVESKSEDAVIRNLKDLKEIEFLEKKAILIWLIRLFLFLQLVIPRARFDSAFQPFDQRKLDMDWAERPHLRRKFSRAMQTNQNLCRRQRRNFTSV